MIQLLLHYEFVSFSKNIRKKMLWIFFKYCWRSMRGKMFCNVRGLWSVWWEEAWCLFERKLRNETIINKLSPLWPLCVLFVHVMLPSTFHFATILHNTSQLILLLSIFHFATHIIVEYFSPPNSCDVVECFSLRNHSNTALSKTALNWWVIMFKFWILKKTLQGDYRYKK